MLMVIDAEASKQLDALINRAKRETSLAYDFMPNSYTNGASQSILAIEQMVWRFCNIPVAQGHTECG